MSIQRENFIHAMGVFDTAGTVTAPPAGTPREFTVVRNGAGDYTVTLAVAIDATERVTLATSATANIIVRIGTQTSTTIQLLTTLGSTGAATDGIVNFIVTRAAN